MAFDCLIKNGLVLTMANGGCLIDRGGVGIKDGAIAWVGPMTDDQASIETDQVIDADGGLVMPGLINTHVHSAMTLFRGLADDLPLNTWLMDKIFPAEAAHVNEELVYWGTKLAAAEMLLSGTTTLADGYFFEEQTARAIHEAGLRAILGQGVLDFPAPGVPDPTRNIETARTFVERWHRVSPLIHPSIFCHSPYTCGPDTLVKGKELAEEFGLLFQIHVAETPDEVERVKAKRGHPPVEYLNSLGLLDQRTLAVHCVHVSDSEIDLLAEKATPVSVCVESQMKLASGLAPVPKMLDRGVLVSLGTDGPASNNNLNMLGEVRSLALVFKASGLDPTVLPAAQALGLAGSAGARALGFGDQLGILAPGYRADLIILDFSAPNMRPHYNPYSHLVYAASGREIRTVLVDGRVLVQDGRITTFDIDETMARVREIARRVAGRG